MGCILCFYTLRDGCWLDLKHDSMTHAYVGSMDSEGFILGVDVLRMMLVG